MRRLAAGLAIVAALLSAAPLSAAGLAGKWRGSYSCLQGHTGLLLTITADTEEAFKGEFAFYPVADNPRVPKGRFAIEGSFNPKSRQVEIRGVAWIERPTNYGMVDLHGTLSEDASAIDGKVEFSGCTSFHIALEGAAHRPTKLKDGTRQGS